MATTVVETSLEGTSPRSTILGAPPSPPSTKMTTDEAGTTAEKQPNTATEASNNNPAAPDSEANETNPTGETTTNNNNNGKASDPTQGTAPPVTDPAAQDQFYGGETAAAYANATTFFPQANGGSTNTFTTAPGANPFAGASPLSPPRAATVVTPGGNAAVPPASPLFPRLNNNNNNAPGGGGEGGNPEGAHPAAFGYGAAPAGASYSNVGTHLNSPVPQTGGAGDETGSWAGNTQHPGSQVHQASPAIPMPYGITSRAASGGRAYSFESDSMLPPAAVDATGEHGTPNPAYSPYGGSTTSSTVQTTPTLFAGAGQQWGYGAAAVPPPDMYGATPPSPLQPRPTHHMMAYPPSPHHHHAPPHHLMAAGAGGMGMRPMPNHMGGAAAPYGAGGGGHHQFFTTSSPGPPIQTTANNKGPDGANLFIFHIPNHFTNLDMFQLFEPYGNLLSVRIMVEKDSGRSRGFGFVSYDSPESAALAIKALNGFAVCSKLESHMEGSL